MTEHFKPWEFACPHCGASIVRPELMLRLERLRTRVNKPIRIVSGYRCPVHNAAVGGARDSQHMYGSAADIPAGIATQVDARAAGFTGIGLKGRWAIHVDVRDEPRATWNY
jgi:uncharacterized protein YcbK (DUF882 family)